MNEANLANVFHAINMVTHAAVVYGGDAGGPYCEDPEDLQQALQNVISLFNADKEYEVRDMAFACCGTMPMIGAIPLIAKKEDMDK